jgi:hypothetical protein
MQQLLAHAGPPPPPQHMQQGATAHDAFGMQPPPPPMPGMAERHQSLPMEAHEFAPPHHDFAPPPPPFDGPAHHAFHGEPSQPPFEARQPEPPSLMDQFSSPPPDHFAEPPLAHPGNGAHSTFNGFLDPMPPMGEHGTSPLPPPHPEAHEPNPLVAAMAQEALSPPAQPSFPAPPSFAPPPQNQMFAPVRHTPAAPRQHAHANGNGNGDATPNGGSNGAGNGAKRRPGPDFSGLPPAMAESLAKLAGVPWPPRPEDDA